MPNHHLNQCWNIANWTIGNKRQWNFNRNQYIFIQENVFENVVCEMAAILSRRRWVTGIVSAKNWQASRQHRWQREQIKLSESIFRERTDFSRHDDVKWKHFPRYTGLNEFPSQRPVMWSFDVFFDRGLNHGWVNNRDAGDLRRHCAHYDVTVTICE